MLKSLLSIVIIALFLGVSSYGQDRYFTVRDSIEMSWFDMANAGDDKDAENPRVEFSPDKRYFAIVTSRGIIHSNATESTIWIFKTAAVRKYVTSEPVVAPLPVIAARRAVVQRVENFDVTSEEPVVFNLRWLPDSTSLLFLGENDRGKRQLYEVNVISGTVHALTSPMYDIVQFVWKPNSIIYEATPPSQVLPAGTPINADAFAVTGLDIDRILFPQNVSSRALYNNLWVIRHGTSIKLMNTGAAYPLHVLNQYPDVLSVSPDGRAAIVLLPVTKIPDSWRLYDPMYSFYKINPNDPKETSQFADHPLMQYALVDTDSGATTLLTGAPNGHALGSWIPSDAVWSHDGKYVLLINTYLPLAGVSVAERGKRVHPCAVAVVDPSSREANCVLFSRQQDDKGSKVLGASFTSRDNEVVVDIGQRASTALASMNQTDERYRYHHDNWELIASHPHVASTNLDPLIVKVHQDLNTPPTLWATEPNTHEMKKFWDPNPQLATMNLGQVSIYHWKDSTGYEWTAGLVKPPNYVPGKRYPLVIQTYIFDRHQFMADGAFTSAYAARPLASAGILVLQMGRRLDHMETPREAIDQVRGFESAIAQLNTDGLIDPKHVGIVGFSRTCYYVESALVKNPQLFAAAALSEGVDFSYMQYLLYGVENFDLAGEYTRMYSSPPFGKGLAAWGEAPGFQLNRLQAPLLIEAFHQDSILTEWEIYASLRMQKKPVDFVYIPDGQHILRKPLDRMASQQGHVDWFRFWLQGYEDLDPAKAAQYKRWEVLRKPP